MPPSVRPKAAFIHDRRFGRRTAVSLAFFAAALCIGCSGEEKEPAPSVAVQAATVERKTIRDVISTEAVVYPKNQASIVPKISAPVEKFYVNRGSRVHAGQLLARLENKDLQAAVEQAKGAYDQAQATYATSTQVSVPADIQAAELNVKETRQAMEAAKAVYDSRLKLFQQGAIARNQLNDSHTVYLQANNQYEIAEAHFEGLQKVGTRAALNSAEGQLASAKGQYEAALANLQYSEIHSPITGVVTDRPLYEGQMAAVGTPLMTVMNLSTVIGRAYVSPKQAAELHVGDAASLTAEGEADAPAKVTVVSPALDPNSTTVQVWVQAANPGGKLKPGSTAGLTIVAKTVKDALVIPAVAVLTGEGGATSVMVIGLDQVAHQTAVKTGIREGAEVEVVSGLKEGERVVTQGAYGLPDGTKVTVSASQTEPAEPKGGENQ